MPPREVEKDHPGVMGSAEDVHRSPKTGSSKHSKIGKFFRRAKDHMLIRRGNGESTRDKKESADRERRESLDSLKEKRNSADFEKEQEQPTQPMPSQASERKSKKICKLPTRGEEKTNGESVRTRRGSNERIKGSNERVHTCRPILTSNKRIPQTLDTVGSGPASSAPPGTSPTPTSPLLKNGSGSKTPTKANESPSMMPTTFELVNSPHAPKPIPKTRDEAAKLLEQQAKDNQDADDNAPTEFVQIAAPVRPANPDTKIKVPVPKAIMCAPTNDDEAPAIRMNAIVPANADVVATPTIRQEVEAPRTAPPPPPVLVKKEKKAVNYAVATVMYSNLPTARSGTEFSVIVLADKNVDAQMAPSPPIQVEPKIAKNEAPVAPTPPLRADQKVARNGAQVVPSPPVQIEQKKLDAAKSSGSEDKEKPKFGAEPKIARNETPVTPTPPVRADQKIARNEAPVAPTPPVQTDQKIAKKEVLVAPSAPVQAEQKIAKNEAPVPPIAPAPAPVQTELKNARREAPVPPVVPVQTEQKRVEAAKSSGPEEKPKFVYEQTLVIDRNGNLIPRWVPVLQKAPPPAPPKVEKPSIAVAHKASTPTPLTSIPMAHKASTPTPVPSVPVVQKASTPTPLASIPVARKASTPTPLTSIPAIQRSPVPPKEEKAPISVYGKVPDNLREDKAPAVQKAPAPAPPKPKSVYGKVPDARKDEAKASIPAADSKPQAEPGKTTTTTTTTTTERDSKPTVETPVKPKEKPKEKEEVPKSVYFQMFNYWR